MNGAFDGGGNVGCHGGLDGGCRSVCRGVVVERSFFLWCEVVERWAGAGWIEEVCSTTIWLGLLVLGCFSGMVHICRFGFCLMRGGRVMV